MYITRRYIGKEDKLSQLNRLLDFDEAGKTISHYGTAATVTRWYNEVPAELNGAFDADLTNKWLNDFEEYTSWMASRPRNTLYRSYTIPKRSGGERRIDEPNKFLQRSLGNFGKILKYNFFALHHTNAAAYITDRNILDCLRKHQQNDWFLATDFHHFFNDTDINTVMTQLGRIWPFCEYFKDADRKAQFKRCLDLAFLNGGLPQGTVLSPMLTNLIMIPFDAELTKRLRPLHITYTRYADDCLFSAKYKFDLEKVIAIIKDVLKYHGYPYQLNDEKTKFGSYKGHNFHLGLIINANHQISIGHDAKRKYKAMCWDMIDRTKPHSGEEIAKFIGLTSYYRSVDQGYIESLVGHLMRKRHWWFYSSSKYFMRNLIARIR